MADDQVTSSAAGQPLLEPISPPPQDHLEEEDLSGAHVPTGQEPVDVPLHLTNPVAHHALSYSTLALLYTFQCIRALILFLDSSYRVTKKVGKGVLRSLQEEVYIFFEGLPFAYRLQDTVVTGPGIRPVQWYYNAGTKQFVAGNLYDSSDDYALQHLPYLSAQIKYNNLNLYDVSEFFEGIRWAGVEAPTPAVLLAAWSLSSGVVLNTQGFSLAVISEQGEEEMIPLQHV